MCYSCRCVPINAISILINDKNGGSNTFPPQTEAPDPADNATKVYIKLPTILSNSDISKTF